MTIILSEVRCTITGLSGFHHNDHRTVYSPAGDILVYDMYATQKEAMTGAKTALEVIAELRKPKAARNNDILSTHRGPSPFMTPSNLTSLRIENVKSNFYSDLLVGKSHLRAVIRSYLWISTDSDVDRLAPGAIVTRTVRDDDHQNIQSKCV